MNFGFGLGRMAEIVNPRSNSPMSSAGRGSFIGDFFYALFCFYLGVFCVNKIY
jgi:hypothetical protein